MKGTPDMNIDWEKNLLWAALGEGLGVLVGERLDMLPPLCAQNPPGLG